TCTTGTLPNKRRLHSNPNWLRETYTLRHLCPVAAFTIKIGILLVTIGTTRHVYQLPSGKYLAYLAPDVVCAAASSELVCWRNAGDDDGRLSVLKLHRDLMARRIGCRTDRVYSVAVADHRILATSHHWNQIKCYHAWTGAL